ncbi:hypothetical protein [Aneurinibacillus aneurinilyticus]|jgi:hypothetical protein|uniref:hypothetical protein n=1 Tax=Aneurinibacillus aneurinilyticus TaxID=1391 RepID=UPI0023FA4114|nr:hypothetical protein [Aneurinibacillus aneurinilyticus]MCI1694285.1 hypothetical protein [Aneurinibacillus aneurinilyticus]
MEELKEFVVNFINNYSKYKVALDLFQKEAEIVYLLNKSIEEISSHIPLSPELEFFYSNFKISGPIRKDGYELKNVNIDIGNATIYLSEPANLYNRQLGFRWIGGPPYKEDPRWNQSWVVIADKDDDPIIVDTSQRNSPVLASYETSEVFYISDSLHRFFEAISVVLEVIYKNFSGEIMDPETFDIKNDFIAVLEEELIKVLNNEEHVSNFMNYLYG